jgi:hypothetical protein
LTPAEFHAVLEGLDLTIEAFAAITGLHRTTCQNWGRARSGRGVQAFPKWVPLLLREWQTHGVPEELDAG